ncbi:hypothetical protein ACNOYE_04860 [Nannocystaceae bacterium ST9]
MTPALQKLTNLMGADRGRRFFDQMLDQLGIDELATPQDSLRFGEALIEQGGVLASIGRSVKIHAILRGAQASESSPPL